MAEQSKAQATCLGCKNFWFTPNERDFSEVTPGSDAAMYCDKDHWEADLYNTWGADLYLLLRTSRKCGDFKLADYAKEEKDGLERPD